MPVPARCVGRGTRMRECLSQATAGDRADRRPAWMPDDTGRLARMLTCAAGRCHHGVFSPGNRPRPRHLRGASQRPAGGRRARFRGYCEGVRAITVIPGKQGSVALTDMPEPPDQDGPILVQTQAIGICGTDLEIIGGEYGSAPPGQDRLIIGHESLGRVAEAAPGTGFGPGDLVVGIVRRRDPVPCPACAAGHWDMCMNGRYTERGIKDRHGYASERYRIHPEYLVAVDPALGILGVLLEPTTVVAKAWDHIEKIGRRAAWAPEKVLITGAGPIGLLAALLATQRGYQTYVLDRVTEGRKPEMVRRLGATYFHSGDLGEAAAEADIIIECTGYVQMLLEAGPQHVRYRIICLTGVSAAGAEAAIDPGQLNRNMVLQNSVLFGSVNANRHHYELAAEALAQADPRLARRPHHPPGAARPVGRRLHSQARRHQDDLELRGRITLGLRLGAS